MPHIVLEGPITLREIWDGFRPRLERHGEKIYRAIMRWPDENLKAGWSRSIKFSFSVEFLILEEIAESV